MRYAPASGLPNSSSLALWARTEEFAPFTSAGGARRSAFKCLPAISVDSSGPLRTISILSLVNTLNDAKAGG
jgi:hypothetical protein